jgi:hypothetical protein
MAVASRAVLAVLITGGPLLLPGPADAAVYYRAQTTATAVHLRLTQEPAGSIITASLFDDAIAYAAGDFETSGGSEALAAPAFPGKLVTQGPGMLCTQIFECPADPPDYPLLADASYPRREHDSVAASDGPLGAGPIALTPLRATATATAAGHDAGTSSGPITLLGGTPVAIGIGNGSAASSVVSRAGSLQVHVESRLTDVTIGGLLRIGSLRSVDDIDLRPGSRPANTAHIVVDDVTVAGQAAVIDDEGVHVAGIDGPALGRRLTTKGIDVRTVEAHRSTTSTTGRSDATALLVDLALPVDGLPYVPNPLPPLPPPFDQIPAVPGVNANGTYVAQVALGSVGAVAGLGRDGDFELGDIDPLPNDPAPETPGGDSRAGGPLAGPDLVDSLTDTPGQLPPAVAPQQGVLRGFFDRISAAAVEQLYAVMALGSIGLLLGWRATVALRRHRWGASTGPRP